MEKKFIITFNGEAVNGVDVSFVSCGEADPSESYEHEQLSWIRTDAMIESANKKDNKDNPLFDYREIALNSTDESLIIETKDADKLTIYRQMIPMSKIVSIEKYYDDSRANYDPK